MSTGVFISLIILILGCSGLVGVLYVVRTKMQAWRKLALEAENLKDRFREDYIRERQTNDELTSRIRQLTEEKNVGNWLPHYRELNDRIEALRRIMISQDNVIGELLGLRAREQARRKKP